MQFMTDLSSLRASIDAIDDQLAELLNRRCDFVREVGAVKHRAQAPGEAFIRPGREARMVRRMAGLFRSGSFPMQAAAQMWRIIISASLSLEAPLTVSACWSDQQQDVYWHAREYFGNITPVTRQSGSRGVLSDVAEGRASVGALPMPDDSPEGGWWFKLPQGVRVFACAPFILTPQSAVRALLVARVEPEETGDDVTLFSIETGRDVSQSRLKLLFEKHGKSARWQAIATFPSGNRAHLVELTGFIAADDPVLAAIGADLGGLLLATNRLGAYASPLTL